MTRNLQLGIEENWNLQYSSSVPSVSYLNDSEGKAIYQKIAQIDIPVAFDRAIIAVSITTDIPTGKTWNYAGYLRRTLMIGIGSSFVGKPEELFLSKFNLIFFEDLNINYFLSLQVPRWFINANINIYQYEGKDTTNVDDTLTRIEQKIDDISNYSSGA
ncbi:hypothetical protein [Nostoc sp. FACHB-888]|uniref:hypothetical protein n=1 Tax=Nostoc sp. FACHB-888 TaxID=2692842 RepID=UPI001683435F|nr:hypothetical protein [Nostoc sp. FACHB-888]MBD2243217.1 hypothetical protein [Nostoc sp. FACHB-888]